MLKRLRSFVLVAIAAVAGSVLGRMVARMRAAEPEPGAMPEDDGGLRLRPQDLVPGVVAAFRVSEPPWSWLHVPGWVAAFAVNFATAAFAGDLGRLREVFESGGISLGDSWSDRSSSSTWTIEDEPPPTATV